MSKVLTSALVLVGVLAGVFYLCEVARIGRGDELPNHVRALYSAWKAKYGRLYATPEEDRHRLKVFYSQKVLVDSYNEDYEKRFKEATGKVLEEPTFEMNQFADLEDEEFKARYAGDSLIDRDQEIIEETDERQLPREEVERVDIKEKKALSGGYDIRVRNQGACGACWVFSGIAAVEKLHFDQTGQRLDLSQQEVIDCMEKSLGCSGGYTEFVFDYIAKEGISLAGQYPYQASQQQCAKSEKTDRVRPRVKKPAYQYFSKTNTKEYIGKGYHLFANLYSSGKFKYLSYSDVPFRADLSGECEIEKDHAVNIVAYSDQSGATILNSWGTRWGKGGFRDIIPCSDGNLYGKLGRISHPYP